MGRAQISLIAVSLGLAAVGASLPAPAGAQTLPYGSSSGADSGADTAAAPAEGVAAPGRSSAGRRGGNGRVRLTPYIEASQVVSAELAPGDDIVTWTSLAAGVDGGVSGRNTAASFSLRYERRIGWGKAASGDVISGAARASVGIVPRTVTIEAGALATRTAIDGSGAALPGTVDRGGTSHLYAVYAGPTLTTNAGPVAVTGAYRIGYTEVGSNSTLVRNGVTAGGDVFDHSTVQNAELHAGTSPGDVLPVGVGVGAGYYQENISNLDQQVKDLHARADVIVPVSMDVALVGGVGYENVRVSSRDVLRDSAGAPVIGSDGRYVTDHSAPRQIAYDTSGFIWDAGVTWRPSRRTALEAHVGRRYGSTTYYGSFAWRATPRSSLNISVYDSISGFGGQINRALVALPTDFEVLRNPVTGDINGCIATPQQGTAQQPGGQQPSGCFTNLLGGVRSATFRGRGIQATYAVDLGRWGTGVAAGYDRRRFIAAPGTILASVNGLVDENTWISAWLSGELDRDSSFVTVVYANWYNTSVVPNGDALALGANASYTRAIGPKLSANAALSLQGTQREQSEDYWTASALVGLRYSF